SKAPSRGSAYLCRYRRPHPIRARDEQGSPVCRNQVIAEVGDAERPISRNRGVSTSGSTQRRQEESQRWERLSSRATSHWMGSFRTQTVKRVSSTADGSNSSWERISKGGPKTRPTR